MKLRIIPAIMLLLLLLLLLPVAASAAQQTPADAGVPLFLNGKQLKPEVEPRIINDVTMVPVRIIAEELGSKVEWHPDSRKVTVVKDSMNIEMVIDRLEAAVNGVPAKLDSAPVLLAGNTLLPVRFVAEHLGVEVNWNEVERAVYLQQKLVEAEKPGSEDPLPVDKPSDASEKPVSVINKIEMTATQLLIQADDAGQLTPSVFNLQNPSRIVIDIPGTALAPSLYKDETAKIGETVSNNVYVSNVRYSLYSLNPSAVRIVLDMKENMELSWTTGMNSASLVAVLQKAPKYKVVIDPGHGDQDPGAKAVNGRTEKEFNLSMGLKVYERLKKETLIEPLLTRSDDTFIALDDRAKFANDRNAALYVSIHGNSYLASLSGTETYYYKEDSLRFAQIMHKHVTAASGLPDRNVRQEPFRVIKATYMPAVLLEIGYLSNEHDSALMFDEAFQNKVADAIVAGIKEQLGIQ
jgi:N-acetylmuramoyl-L-alanine amidase